MSQLYCFGKKWAWWLGVIFLASAFSASPGRAQDASQAVDRAQLLRTPATLRDDQDDETNSGGSYAVASPNDPDLGEQAILKRSEEYLPFNFSAALPFSFTSNAALSSTGEKSDILFAPVASFIYAPRLAKNLFANFSVSQQFFYYGALDELDFASLNLHAGLTYAIPAWHNLVLRAGYEFSRLTAGDDLGDEFFSDHSLGFSAELPFRIGRAQQISIGTDISFSIAAEPEEPARDEYSFFVGYSVNVTRSLNLAAVGRVSVRDYVEIDRTDVAGILALSASYRFTKDWSFNVISTLATNDSDRDVFDYDVFNLGGALSLSLRF